MSSTAQTITATLDTAALGYVSSIGAPGFVCGHTQSYCYGVPFVFADGTVERVWLDTATNSHFAYWTADPLGLQGYTGVDGSGFYGAQISGVDYTTTPATYSFHGTTESGQPYTGKFSLTFRSYYSRGGGGKGGGGAGTFWVITGGTMSITVN